MSLFTDDWGLHSYRNFSAPAINTSRVSYFATSYLQYETLFTP